MTCCQADSDEEGLYGTETGKKEEREAGSHATDKQDLTKRYFPPPGVEPGSPAFIRREF